MPCMRKALCARSRQQQTRKDEDHMKKILSLLLALTLVLSLVVVPARADADTYAFAGTEPSINVSATGLKDNKVDKGTEVTFTLNASGLKVTKNNVDLESPAYRLEYQWVGATAVGDDTVAKVTPTSAGPLNVSCTIKAYDGSTKLAEKVVNATAITVNDKITATDVASVIFNHRTYNRSSDGSFTVYYLNSERAKITTLTQSDWSISSSTVTLTSVEKDGANIKLNLSKAQGEGQEALVGSLTVTCTQATATGNVSVSAPALASGEKYRAGTELTLSVPDSSNKNSQNVRYVWSATKDGTALPSVTVSSANKWTPSAAGKYVLTRTVYEGSDEVGKQTSGTIEVKADNYRAAIISPARALSVTPNSSRILFALSFRDYSTNTTTGLPVSLASTDVTWTVSGGNAKFEENNSTTYTAKGFGIGSSVAEPGTAYAYLLPGSAAASTITVTASFTYNNKLYTVRFNNLSVVSMTAKLNATYYGAGSTYTSSSLAYYADSAIKSYSYAQLASGESVSSVLIDTIGMNSNGLGQFSNFSSASITFTPYVNSFGKATFTGTAVTNKNNRFAITFSIPVTPVPVNSFDSQTAEPISTSSVNTSYKVSAPSSYTKFYVLGNSSNLSTNQTIDYSQYSAAQLNSMGYTSTTLPSTYFGTSGQCTLYVIAWNDSTSYTSYSRYYCGPMTVTQTNYNINYNGVAGETVQFAQSDFTDFMNEVAEARGDASKTKSYPYVTFDYVTFSLPTTAQGTLYYGGTAMSTSNSSGAFNTRTKVTNLDSVTFVPNAKTTAKTITLNFTLYATRYSSSSTSRGTPVSSSGASTAALVSPFECSSESV